MRDLFYEFKFMIEDMSFGSCDQEDSLKDELHYEDNEEIFKYIENKLMSWEVSNISMFMVECLDRDITSIKLYYYIDSFLEVS